MADMPTFLATTGNGLARATCGANRAWSVEFPLAGQHVRCLAADPRDTNVVYAGTQVQGLLRSDNGGQTWRPVGLAGFVITTLAVSRAVPGTLYAGTKPALLFVSHDDGANWLELAAFRRIRSRWFWFSPAEKPFTAYVQGIALSPTHPQIIHVGIEFGAVVRSQDGGQTWSAHRRGALRDCHSLISHTASGNWVYEAGGSGAGVAISKDAGVMWAQPKAGLDRHYGWAVAADPARPEVWYAALAPSPWKAHSANNAQAHIFRALGEMPWHKLAGGLPQPLNHMPYALLTDPATPGLLCAGLSNGDVWYSADCGDSWRQLAFNLTGIHRTLLLL
jgi:BNR/Asp-box repeat